MRSRPIDLTEDGSVALKRGRLYRLVLLVNGAAKEADVLEALAAWGFAEQDTAISGAEQWEDDCPSDWPEEQAHEPAVNERVFRASGSLAGRSLAIGRDYAIAGGAATASVLEAWDYGPTNRFEPATTGAKAKEHDDQEEQKRHDRSTLVIVGIALAGTFALWRMGQGTAAIDHEAERMAEVEERALKAKRETRIRELMAGGVYNRTDAEAIAETESWGTNGAGAAEHREAV